jgi:hypothetical protein
MVEDSMKFISFNFKRVPLDNGYTSPVLGFGELDRII